MGFGLALLACGQGNEPVIRITTSLVQIDAIVTDRNGKLVTDLRAGDFEILQDGKRRDVTAFSVVRVATESRPAVLAGKGSIPPPPLPSDGVKREQVRRTVAILVDDLSIGFADMPRVRQAVARFVQEEVREGDLVAIITARGGMGIYSQFTTDRALLLNAAERLVWKGLSEQPDLSTPIGSEESRALQLGSRGAVLEAIRGLRDMPGRKSIVLFSGGSAGVDPSDPMLERIADEATRAAVTVYAIDARGVQTFMPTADTARPDYKGASTRAVNAFLSQSDMSILTERTGGLFFKNDNGLRELLVQAIEDQSSYYLLGYNPGTESFDRRFHKIEVRVLRPGLTVRSRTGYVGVEDRPVRRVLDVAARRMVRALLAPFQSNDLHTRLTAAFRGDGGKPRVTSQLWIDGGDLKFERWEDGKYHTELEVIVASFDPAGALQEHAERGYRVNLTEEQLPEVRRSGLLYSISYPAKKPGPYQVRMAVRELKTEHVGTASQFLITPDLSKDRLALSGMFVKGFEDQKGDKLAKPWMVVVKLGRGIDWEAEVYHPKLNKGVPQLMAAQRLFRDGELVMEGKPYPVVVPAALKRKEFEVPVRGSVRLDESFAPGEYVLQLIVTDENDKSKAVTQAIGFQVAR